MTMYRKESDTNSRIRKLNIKEGAGGKASSRRKLYILGSNKHKRERGRIYETTSRDRLIESDECYPLYLVLVFVSDIHVYILCV